METDSTAGAVILGGDFLGLGIIRCLAEHNVPMFLVDYELSISRFSRYIKRRAFDKNLLDEDYLTKYLIKLAKDNELNGWVLYPTTDKMLKIISMNLDELKKWYKIPLPDWEVVKKFYYKEISYQVAEQISIPIPKLYKHNNLDDLLKQDLYFPLVLKPSFRGNYFSKTKNKAVRVDNREQLIKEFEMMSSIIETSQIIVQEMIEGGPSNLYSYSTFFDGEKNIGEITAVRLRQHPMDFGKATTYAEIVEVPEIVELGNRILKEIGYWGIAEVEFMKDNKQNVFKFIEINGRFWGWHTLAREAGINYPHLLYKYMLGEKITAPKQNLGVKWIRMITDIPTVFLELVNGRMTLKAYLRTLKGRKQYAEFSLADPLPFFMELLMIPYLWKKRGY